MIHYQDISLKEIDLIKPLWESNRKFHEESSTFFGQSYKKITFEEKRNYFYSLKEESIKITVSMVDKHCIGYCLSFVNNDIGEVNSLHVHYNYRGNGVGEKLVSEHIKWMKDRGCLQIGVNVSQENSKTISFYKKLGFFPNTIYMQQKEGEGYVL